MLAKAVSPARIASWAPVVFSEVIWKEILDLASVKFDHPLALFELVSWFAVPFNVAVIDPP